MLTVYLVSIVDEKEKEMHKKLRMKSICGAFALCANLVLICGAVRADTATFAPSKDNTLVEDATGSLSNGAGTSLFAGQTSQGENLRAVIAFDIQSIPSGSTITGVTLTLHAAQFHALSIPFVLHRLTKNWGEGTSSTFQGPNGSATTNDATWIHTFYNTQFWTTPGGDFTATASATQNVAGAGFYTWGSTAGIVSDVQQWLDTPATNFGWILIGGEDSLQTAKRFDSRENSTETNRPKLTVTYTTPPATAAIAGTLTLQGIAPAAPAQTITFTLHPSDNSGDTVKTASVAPNGTFQLSNVPRKNYAIRIKGDRYLAVRVNGVNASGGNVSGVTALLKVGDGNNDNAVDITDLLLLIAHYNQTQGSGDYLSAVDFNGDATNDITDLLLLIANYNQLGDS